jgi:formyltetrahydrofolate deformylase
MDFSLHDASRRPRIAIFASSEAHCLYDLLSRHESGELRMDIRCVVSNHGKLEPAAARFGIPFHHIPVTAATKAAGEASQLELLERENVDTIILARYMQILSGDFTRRYPNRIINIHHSFLPAFPGARPYHSAYLRGVKVIGATSHYVTEELDDGPIIAQDVVPVTHRESIADFIRHGRDLERIVLARAVWWHVERKILVYDNKTVVFD